MIIYIYKKNRAAGSIAEQVMQCYISPNLMKKQTHLHQLSRISSQAWKKDALKINALICSRKSLQWMTEDHGKRTENSLDLVPGLEMSRFGEVRGTPGYPFPKIQAWREWTLMHIKAQTQSDVRNWLFLLFKFQSCRGTFLCLYFSNSLKG